MERDFMGLNVKQETSDETIDAAPLRTSAMQWSFSNKGPSSSLSQLLSFQEEKLKTSFDSLASTGLVNLTTTEAFDSDQKPYPVAQKLIVPEKKGGVHYTVAAYPAKHVDTHSIHRPAATNQTNLTISPAVTSLVATSGQTLIGSVSSQPLAGVPMTNPLSAVPSGSPVVGTTDLRNSLKISGAPAQLTIFYNGSVCVYDNISAEKAQAIMLLAGNGPPTTPPAAPAQASIPRSSVLDGFVVSQPYGITPHRPRSVLVSSIGVSQPAGRTSPNNDTTAAKPAGVNSLGPVSVTFFSSGSVPQFRRKSLARFLEKRKERVISATPYSGKQSPECSNPVNSPVSCPVPAMN